MLFRAASFSNGFAQSLVVSRQRSIDQTGNESVHRDVVLTQLDRGRPHQARDAPLGRRVAGSVLDSVPPLHRRKQDKSALLSRDHLGRECPDGVRSAVQIVVDDISPVRIIHVEERHPFLYRSVRHHDIDLTK